MNNKPIINFIEDEEIHEFTEDIAQKKRVIAIFVAGSMIFLVGISAYVLPDFLLKDHKEKMQYHADMFISNNDNIVKTKEIKTPNFHSSGNK